MCDDAGMNRQPAESGLGEHVDSSELSLVLSQERVAIVDLAAESVRRRPTHYAAAGSEETRRRLEALYDQLLTAISSRDLVSTIEYAQHLGAERFESGYDLAEVQGAFNALEEAAWSVLCARLPPDQLAASLGFVSTALGRQGCARARICLTRLTVARALPRPERAFHRQGGLDPGRRRPDRVQWREPRRQSPAGSDGTPVVLRTGLRLIPNALRDRRS